MGYSNVTNCSVDCLNVTTKTLNDDLFGDSIPLEFKQKLFWSILFGLMIVCSVTGNLIVIIVVLTTEKMKNLTNYFIVNLSVTDIVVSVFNVIFNMIYMLNSNWPFGYMYCKISNFIAVLSVSASVFTLVTISIDR